MLDLLVLVAFSILSIGILLQIKHTCKRKSVKDISIFEVVFRNTAGFVLVLKNFALNDIYLIWGGTVLFVINFIYVLIVLKIKFWPNLKTS